MDHLDIPINCSTTVLTKKQHNRLIDICRNTINAFLKDPTEGRERYIEILEEPNAITKKAIKDVEAGKVKKAKPRPKPLFLQSKKTNPNRNEKIMKPNPTGKK